MGYIYGMSNNRKNDSMGSIIIRDVDEGLRKQFRMLCLEKEISMNQSIKDFVAWAVKNGKLLPSSKAPGLTRLEEARGKP